MPGSRARHYTGLTSRSQPQQLDRTRKGSERTESVATSNGCAIRSALALSVVARED